MEGRTRDVEAAGATLVVREWGDADGRPIVFWHALGPAGSGATNAEPAAVLAERGFRVAAIDGPGFGASPPLPPERYELPALVDLLETVVSALGLVRPVLMGHSWGGAIVVHAAARRPEQTRALVLLDSGHMDYGDLDEVDPDRPLELWIEDARARQWRWSSRAAFEQDLREAVRRWTPELRDAFLSGLHDDGDEVAGSAPEARAAAFRGLARARQSAAWPTIAAAQLPVLLLLATDDPWGAQNREHLPRFTRVLPDAEVRWAPDTSHALPADLGPELGRTVADWLEART